MKKLTKTELKRILKEHKKWVETGNVEGCRADLTGVNLYRADLRDAELSMAILCDANLNEADLRGADLSSADLVRASLIGADLSKADLCFATLDGANLRYADLTDAALCEARLINSDLTGAKLRNVELDDADLTGVYLDYPIACPEKGSFIGYKKVKTYEYKRNLLLGLLPILVGEYIIELEIPAEAKRCSATSRKCRCEYAKVLAITNLDGTKTDVKSIVNHTFASPCTYTVGEYVYPDSFDENRWNECSHGIHFFITRQEAVDY